MTEKFKPGDVVIIDRKFFPSSMNNMPNIIYGQILESAEQKSIYRELYLVYYIQPYSEVGIPLTPQPCLIYQGYITKAHNNAVEFLLRMKE